MALIGANTLLLPPSMWLQGKPVANRLKLRAEWTKAGGGLAMIGGYLSFQDLDGRARWRRTPVEDVLPVTLRQDVEHVSMLVHRTPGVVQLATDAEEHRIAMQLVAWPWTGWHGS